VNADERQRLVEEVKARQAVEQAAIARLEEEIARLAKEHMFPVLLVMMRGLVEMVCAQHGEIFRDHHKHKFYEGVLLMLRQRGIA
jgi:hypothetical protein